MAVDLFDREHGYVLLKRLWTYNTARDAESTHAQSNTTKTVKNIRSLGKSHSSLEGVFRVRASLIVLTNILADKTFAET